MKEQDEKLSYLLDDYADENASGNVDEVIGDVNLQYRMRRYRMIGEIMRHELPPAIDTGFHEAVMARIAREVGAVQDRKPRAMLDSSTPAPLLSRGIFKPIAGLAVAASVAIVTVALWQPQSQDARQPDAGLAEADQIKIQQLAGQRIAGSAVPVSTGVPTRGTRWKIDRGSPELQQKLNAYLVNHTEYSNSVQGLIPQARVAGFDAQQ
ncbi:MAG: RseA family anti-sigma factor [Gammaproteobacteria bacterium]|nr:RseA family anti-sigma factor [Gammaproteobacteria bacterium]MDH3450582.1 RseA family anti-sigma factor [Gammaproteobacteria bacterium]